MKNSGHTRKISVYYMCCELGKLATTRKQGWMCLLKRRNEIWILGGKELTVLIEIRLSTYLYQMQCLMNKWPLFLLHFSCSNSIVKPPSSLLKVHWLQRKTISPVLPMFSYQFHLSVERVLEKLAFSLGKSCSTAL